MGSSRDPPDLKTSYLKGLCVMKVNVEVCCQQEIMNHLQQTEICITVSRRSWQQVHLHCWNFGLIFQKWSEILTFPPNWSELGILFHEKLEKLTFHMKLASIFA